jgi:hypothetical protein
MSYNKFNIEIKFAWRILFIDLVQYLLCKEIEIIHVFITFLKNDSSYRNGHNT